MMENHYSDNINNADLLYSHGHIGISAGARHSLKKLTLSSESRMQVTEDLTSYLEPVSREFAESEASNEFRKAFTDLNLGTFLLEKPKKKDDKSFVQWPSKTSWQKLLRESPEKLKNYLESYRKLLVFAETNEILPIDKFWAHYPFCGSIWDPDDESARSCKAIFMSPLHPIRMYWLAKVELGLGDAETEIAAAFAGTIEGWNFPMIGPLNIKGGNMVALPR